MISDSALEALHKTALFAGFTDEQLKAVPEVARPRTFSAGQMIVHEGDTVARSLWVVLEGEVEIRIGGESLRTEGPGSYFGEMALLTDAPRSADVVAHTDVTALELRRDHLRGLIHANPDVAMAMLAELSIRLQRLSEVTADLLRSSPEAAAAAESKGLTVAPGPSLGDLGPIEWGLLFGGGG